MIENFKWIIYFFKEFKVIFIAYMLEAKKCIVFNIRVLSTLVDERHCNSFAQDENLYWLYLQRSLYVHNINIYVLWKCLLCIKNIALSRKLVCMLIWVKNNTIYWLFAMIKSTVMQNIYKKIVLFELKNCQFC